MKAAIITEPGGPEVLEIREMPTPEPGAEQVRVRVRAAGLNRADVHQRKGGYAVPPGSPRDIPGLEFAGEVDALGSNVFGVKQGQRVYGLCGGGAQAEYVVVHERMLVPIPESLDFVAAGGVPEVFITAHDGLFTQADLRLGETVLVHAAGSGVGTAAIQLARAAGARVLGTSRTPEKLERARAIGLEVAIAADGFAEAVLAETGGAGAHVILDFIGGPYLATNLQALALKGRLVILSTLGARDEPLPLRLLMSKRARVMGSLLRARPLEEKIAATRAFATQVNPLLASGALRPIIDRVFDLDEISAAHRYMEEDRNFGKIILRI